MKNGLGQSAASCLQFLHELKSAWGIIGNTPVGKMLTHMAVCADLAFNGQAKPFIIVEDRQYLGSCVLGQRYVLSINHKLHEPMSPEGFISTLTDLQPARSYVSRILAIAGLATDPKTIKTMRHLHVLIRDRDLNDSKREEIISLANKFSLNAPYWAFNPTSINLMIDYLLSSTDPDNSVPLYPKFLFAQTRIERVLAAFGPYAPSLNFPNGTPYEIGTDGFKELKHLTFQLVSTEIAASDMKAVLTTRIIRQLTSTNIGGSVQLRQLSTRDGVEEIKRKLISLSNATKPEDATSTGDAPTKEELASYDFI